MTTKLINLATKPVRVDEDDALLISPQSIVQVAGSMVRVGVELTRPNDVNGYIAKDVVANLTSGAAVLTFPGLARAAGGSGYLVKARMMTSQKTNVAQFRLHLFHVAPAAINDNSPYLLLYANAPNRVGQIDFDALKTEDSANSTGAGNIRDDIRLPFVCGDDDTALYGILETLTAFTPAALQKFYLELTAERN